MAAFTALVIFLPQPWTPHPPSGLAPFPGSPQTAHRAPSLLIVRDPSAFSWPAAPSPSPCFHPTCPLAITGRVTRSLFAPSVPTEPQGQAATAPSSWLAACNTLHQWTTAPLSIPGLTVWWNPPLKSRTASSESLSWRLGPFLPHHAALSPFVVLPSTCRSAASLSLAPSTAWQTSM